MRSPECLENLQMRMMMIALDIVEDTNINAIDIMGMIILVRNYVSCHCLVVGLLERLQIKLL